MVLLAYALSFLTETQELADLTGGLLRGEAVSRTMALCRFAVLFSV